jgi:hypothetical protein
VQRHGAKTALVDPVVRLTYAELGQLVDRCLAFLDMGSTLATWYRSNCRTGISLVVQYALSRIGAVGNPDPHLSPAWCALC